MAIFYQSSLEHRFGVDLTLMATVVVPADHILDEFGA